MPQISISIEDLVSMIDRGELRLPEMQRRYVWRAPRVRDLMDSLYRGYLMLRKRPETATPFKEYNNAQ